MSLAKQEPGGCVVDPHRTGFGRISATAPRVRSPPVYKVTNGILGVHPAEATRGDDPVDKRGVGKSDGGDGTKVEDDKPLHPGTPSSSDLGFRPASIPSSPSSQNLPELHRSIRGGTSEEITLPPPPANPMLRR